LIALHTFPKAIMSLAFWELIVGYAFVVEMVKGSVQEWSAPTYLVDSVQKFALFLWRQPPNLWQQLLVNNPIGSLRSQKFGWQIAVHKIEDCGFSPDRIASRSKRSARGRHGEKFFGRDREVVLI